MSVHLGQLRKWHHTVEGQSDFFVEVRRIGKFIPTGHEPVPRGPITGTFSTTGTSAQAGPRI